ncbi:MAG: alpha/beta hydrolase [Dehalococcoidia bacterium]
MADTLAIDPQLFRPDAINPETAALNNQLAAAGVSVPESAVALRTHMAQGVFGGVSPSSLAQERLLPGPHGPISVRVFVPDTVQGVYLDIHGGGWSLFSAAVDDQQNERIARTCQLAVVSVDYRLAPEHPYPIPVDECEAVALWLVQQAQAEFGAERLFIGGGSAGGHLAAVTLLRLRDRHGYTGCAGANLVYGCYDMAWTPSLTRYEGPLALNRILMDWCRAQFVPDSALWRDPDVSPLYADLHDMPPALFTVGTLDPLLDDTLFMSARWLAAGNQTELAIYPGGTHGFHAFPTRLAEQARERMLTFLRAALAEKVAT